MGLRAERRISAAEAVARRFHTRFCVTVLSTSMKKISFSAGLLAVGLTTVSADAAPQSAPVPVAQRFRQELATCFAANQGPTGEVQLVEIDAGGVARAFASGHWWQWREAGWQELTPLAPSQESEFVF